MYAVEFQATVKNGHIELPRQYRAKVKDRVRVIVLMEGKADKRSELLAELLANPIPLKSSENNEESYIEYLMDNRKTIPDFKPLTREEIYAERE